MRKMGIWREYLIEKLADRESAINYLQAILEDYQIFEDSTVVLRSLHTIVEAQGGVCELAKQTGMDPQVLSKGLSNEATPLIDVLTVVLKALGCQLSIQPIDPENLNLEAYTDVLETQITDSRKLVTCKRNILVGGLSKPDLQNTVIDFLIIVLVRGGTNEFLKLA